MSFPQEHAIEARRWVPDPRLVLLGLLATGGVLAYVIFLGLALGFPLPPASAFGVFAAATISSVAGFAFSALCGPVLAHAGMEPVRMVQTMMLCSIAIQGWSVFVLRHEIDVGALSPLLIGGVLGLPVGVLILMSLPPGTHAVPFGSIILAYGVWMLLRPPLRLQREPGRFADLLVGACAGITGGLAAFPGAFVAVWCGMKGWPKERQRGVTQTFILLIQIAALGMIAAIAPSMGLASLPDLRSLAYVPPALLGAGCGLLVFRRLNDRTFGRAVSLLLMAGGIAMLT